jgi:hypothetical protein
MDVALGMQDLCSHFYVLIMLLLGADCPPLWSSGQSSWLRIQRSGFESRSYQIFWEVVGMERGPLSLVSTIEEPHGRKSSGSGLEIREYGRSDPLRWHRGTLYPQKLVLTLPTSGCSSVGIVHSLTHAKEFCPSRGDGTHLTLRTCKGISVMHGTQHLFRIWRHHRYCNVLAEGRIMTSA